MSIGGGYSASNSETDASANISGSTGNYSSADRVSQQFINLGSGTAALDFNSYLESANAGFYESVAGAQVSEAASVSSDKNFKYLVLGSMLLISAAAIAFRGRK